MAIRGLRNRARTGAGEFLEARGMPRLSEAVKPEKCRNCQKDAIVCFKGFWLCKECFNNNAEQAGRLVQKLCQQSKTP